MKMKTATLALLLVAAVSSAQAVSQPKLDQFYVNQVKIQFLRVLRATVPNGYLPSRELIIDAIYPDKSMVKDHTLPLEKGFTYGIFGACDGDCLDLDFVLFDADDNLISIDPLKDDSPAVSVTPRETGEFTLRVGIPSCTARRCTYGIGIFAKPTN